jgi:hypothetical protein
MIHRHLNRAGNRPQPPLPVAYRLVARLAHAQGGGQRVLRVAHTLAHGYEVSGGQFHSPLTTDAIMAATASAPDTTKADASSI